MKTRTLATAALMTAVSVVLLYAASVLPTGRLALVAIASILPAAAVLSGGIKWGLLVYAATAALSLILLPNKTAALLYAVLLGHYSLLKSLIERLNRLVLEWILKLVVFNVLLAAVYGLCRMMGLLVELPWAIAALALAGNVGFVLYDLAFSQLIMRFGRYFR